MPTFGQGDIEQMARHRQEHHARSERDGTGTHSGQDRHGGRAGSHPAGTSIPRTVQRTMTSRERVSAALQRKPVDRVPVFMWFHPETAAILARHLHIPASLSGRSSGQRCAPRSGWGTTTRWKGSCT
ncbi:MAG: uroporphyrinogen decarboxylase family protein [Ignavibacteriales bacterium]|nr:uroporphyrinogen decarboxylase family protein [Ignavibacteriales bacterium]